MPKDNQIKIKELETIFLPIILAAFRKKYEHKAVIGILGLDGIRKNQFGETTLRMDFEAEEIVLESLRKFSIPTLVHSEEHGKVKLNGTPSFLATIDGLDGSSAYKKNFRQARCGTMFSLFSNTKPMYEDSLISISSDFSNGNIYWALKGKGAFKQIGKEALPIKTTDKKALNENTFIYVDEGVEVNKEYFSKRITNFNIHHALSSAVHWIDLASGKADIVAECTRKGNLEISCAYRLIREAGGVIVTMDKEDIGSKQFLSFGQNEHIPLVGAASKNLALSFLKYIKG